MKKNINNFSKRRMRVRTRIGKFNKLHRPRMTVFRSNKHIHVQIIDDQKSITMVSASTIDKELRGKISKTWNLDAAKEVGRLIAKRANEMGIKSVVFDKGAYKYHGRVMALADAARENNMLDF